MPYFATDLPSFPAIPIESAQEKRFDPIKIAGFSGEQEQRISYAGPRRRGWEVKTPWVRSATVDLFVPFWEGRAGQMHPFQFTWRQTLYYVRFDGEFSISWHAPDLGQISFSLKEMHPAEIIV
ncbi:MAG: hypothetical protein HQL79_07475 [Magnetococcales bacterium]|nr:hypothetical protein [Magnetococcales bacterium]